MELTLIPFAESPLCDAVQTALNRLGYNTYTLPSDQWLGRKYDNPGHLSVLLLDCPDIPHSQIKAGISHHGSMPIFALVGKDRLADKRSILCRCSDFSCWPCSEHELAYRLGRLAADTEPTTVHEEEHRIREEFVDLNLIGRSPAFLRALIKIKKISRCDAPVLIEGETGTGKELAARAIHYLSSRRDQAFIPVNCGALPDNLIENELFGHRKGAFTDARQDQPGLIELARNGTLFLDEIEALSVKGQVALLRFLEDQRYRPLGGRRIEQADVRIIAASNTPISDLVSKRLFRQDLFFRLNILILVLPPLRERPEDIRILAHHFLEQYQYKYGETNVRFSPHLIARMKVQQWPGNIRELENFVYREVMLGNSAHTDTQTQWYPRGDGEEGSAERDNELDLDVPFNEAKRQAIAEFEQRYLGDVMNKARGNVTLAAKLAGKERRALGKLLVKYKIDKSAYLPVSEAES